VSDSRSLMSGDPTERQKEWDCCYKCSHDSNCPFYARRIIAATSWIAEQRTTASQRRSPRSDWP